MSSYNTYFLITKDGGKNFDIVGLQIDDIIHIGTEIFIKKEETEIIEAKFKAKIQIIQEISTPGDFNVCYMIIKAKSIIVV